MKLKIKKKQTNRSREFLQQCVYYMLYLQSKLVGIQVLTNLLELLPLNEKGIYMNEIYTEPWWSMDISSFWQFVLSVKALDHDCGDNGHKMF
jgi:hypothetical protein